jgi:gas vesicle protein
MTYPNIVNFFTGFLIGALIGGALSLLLAPQSGEETRSLIRDQSHELKQRAEEQVDGARQQVENVRARALKAQEQGQALIEENSKKLKEVANKAKAQVPIVG